MSKEATDLIERMERETGCRIDENEGDNLAMDGLFGALARIMGKSPKSYREYDDVAVGLLIKYRMSKQYENDQRGKEIIASMLSKGLSPDHILNLFK